MKIAGFTFIRNAIKYDYPVVEAIQSILPLCEKVFVAVGNSEDATLDLIQSIAPDKIVIIPTIWDESLRVGGKVLAEETNKAFDTIPKEYDWCFYIQGDEAIHEKYIPVVKNAMTKYLKDPKVEGLLFKYLHFYGSYEYVGDAPNWYRREIRVIKNDKSIRSYKDAQGFRKNNQKLQVKLIDAYIYHYGWVKNPLKQVEKALNFSKYWHSDDWMEEKKQTFEMFDYSEIDSLATFTETHPQVMLKRISQQNWDFKFDITKKKLGWKNKLKMTIEKWTGYRIGEYKNYKII
jgi:hypothetical protein